MAVGGVCGGQQGSGKSCYERKRDLLEVGGCSAAVGETGGKELSLTVFTGRRSIQK